MNDIFSGIITQESWSYTHLDTPRDFLIRWWGIEEAMLDLFLRPEMVYAAYEGMVEFHGQSS
jgi:hypothetical protein